MLLLVLPRNLRVFHCLPSPVQATGEETQMSPMVGYGDGTATGNFDLPVAWKFFSYTVDSKYTLIVEVELKKP